MVQMSHWQLPCTHFYLKNVIAEKEKMEAFIILNRRNQLIGAGSVVTRDIPPYSLAAGNPCRVIRKITEKDHMK